MESHKYTFVPLIMGEAPKLWDTRWEMGIGQIEQFEAGLTLPVSRTIRDIWTAFGHASSPLNYAGYSPGFARLVRLINGSSIWPPPPADIRQACGRS